MSKKQIYISQPNIKANAQDQGNRPVICIKTSQGYLDASQIRILGPSELRYVDPPPEGLEARVWLETDSEVEIIS